jgi:hypothetical protein
MGVVDIKRYTPLVEILIRVLRCDERRIQSRSGVQSEWGGCCSLIMGAGGSAADEMSLWAL